MNLLDDDLNLACLDGRKCMKCGQIPPIHPFCYVQGQWIECDEQTYREIQEDNARSDEKPVYVKIDRSNRVDCDAAEGSDLPQYQVYCFECWRDEVLHD